MSSAVTLGRVEVVRMCTDCGVEDVHLVQVRRLPALSTRYMQKCSRRLRLEIGGGNDTSRNSVVIYNLYHPQLSDCWNRLWLRKVSLHQPCICITDVTTVQPGCMFSCRLTGPVWFSYKIFCQSKAVCGIFQCGSKVSIFLPWFIQQTFPGHLPCVWGPPTLGTVLGTGHKHGWTMPPALQGTIQPSLRFTWEDLGSSASMTSFNLLRFCTSRFSPRPKPSKKLSLICPVYKISVFFIRAAGLCYSLQHESILLSW